ncbi:MAG TPA: hypothetical protein PLA68_04635 [Panacibacter sp.]|nr:hypothetical protein [Panacibacter sp.]
MAELNSKKAIIILISVATVALNNTVNAQKLVFIFGHGLYASPLDQTFKDGYNKGLGVEGGAGIGWNKTFIMGTSGYSSFSSASGNGDGNITIIPLKAGIRQYLIGKLLYLHGDLGLASVKSKISSAQSKFSADFGAGVKFGGFELQLDYDGFSKSEPSGYASFIGLKAGFAIGL